jgi:hypothetical protein
MRGSKRGLVLDRRLRLGMCGMPRTRPSKKKILYAVDPRRSSTETTRAEAQLDVAVNGSTYASIGQAAAAAGDEDLVAAMKPGTARLRRCRTRFADVQHAETLAQWVGQRIKMPAIVRPHR